VYDTDFKDLKDPSTMTSLHTLNKFVREGWKGQAYVLRGKLPTRNSSEFESHS